MARNYTSAARRAAATPPPAGDLDTVMAWIDGNTTRARQVLAALDKQPVDPTDTAARLARKLLREKVLDVFPSFTLDDVAFRVLGEMQLLDLCELMRLNKRNIKTVDPAAVAALADFFQGALGADEYERFREYCRTNCVDQDVLNDVMEGIVEDLSEVPTSRPSHSVGGPSSAGPTSTDASPPPMSPEAFEDFLASRTEPQPGPLGLPETTNPTREFVYFG
ncbi:hypothetical protein ACN261_31545 [Micromonospora sp. WMMD723]|uniref:hypothetical protein n=1 Tax=Micromonospora sp. WMMD723 TaxID=3403465 RepID=UPI003CED7D26